MKTIFVLLLSTVSLLSQTLGDPGFVASLKPEEVGGGASFSDAFTRTDNDSLGANWTEADTDIDIVSNAAKSAGTFDNSQSFAIYTGTACNTVSQYVKMTWTSTGISRPSIYLRYTASGPYYEVSFNQTDDLVYWIHWTGVGGTRTEIPVTPPSLTMGTTETVGVTITGTGNSTVVKVWLSPTGDAPTDASTWGGSASNVTFTDDPASAVNTGNNVGIGTGLNNNSDVIIDDFFGGDIP